MSEVTTPATRPPSRSATGECCCSRESAFRRTRAWRGRPSGPIDETGARRVLGILGSDGRAHWHPAAETPLQAGEELMVAATRAGLAELLQLSGTTTAAR
jgi:hypothetical protein